MSDLRIGYLIGALERGGSERQLVELAGGMVRRGHRVAIACYDGPGALDAVAQERGATVVHMSGGTKPEKVRRVQRWVAEYQPHILHGFMKRASSLAVLARRRAPGCRVIASDLSTATYARHKPDLWAALVLFGLADRVATQTEQNKRSLGLLAPWIRRKTVVIRNGVDLGRFHPGAPIPEEPFRFVCVGSVYRAKNPVAVVAAVDLLRKSMGRAFRLDWYGRPGLGERGATSSEYREAEELIRRARLEDVVAFRGETKDVDAVYREAHALVHASLQDGVPNAVVEAMASGLPVVVSRVSDLPLIVAEARNGFVCDERRPDRIAEAMASMMALGVDARRSMGERSVELARRWFGLERVVAEYEALYGSPGACRVGRGTVATRASRWAPR
jgi:glycosyltransferase involved in cell wall biosynthesis